MSTRKEKLSPEDLLLRQHLQRMRNKAKMTQVSLAEKLKKPQSYVSKIETGERGISFLEMRTICKACKMDFMKFIKGLETDLADSGD